MLTLDAFASIMLASAVASAAPIIDVYISAPGVATPPVVGALVQTFDGVQAKNHNQRLAWTGVGYYDLSNSNRYTVQSSDLYGGAGNTGRYAVFGAQNSSFAPIPLQFNQAQDYFGFWWSAGDPNNTLSLYSGSLIIASFATADLITMLRQARGQIVSIDGKSTYQKSAYFGKPGTGQNAGEPYVYLSFVARGGRFDRVVLGNSESMGTGFESDNHAVYRGDVVMPGSEVYLTTLTPEPGTDALAGAALIALASLRRRRLRSRQPRGKLRRAAPDNVLLDAARKGELPYDHESSLRHASGRSCNRNLSDLHAARCSSWRLHL